MEAAAVSNLSVELPGWQAPQDLRTVRVHMVGVGGCGMSGLASVLLRWGATVSGVDAIVSPIVERLRERGARVSRENGVSALPAKLDVVVASAAVRATHPDLVEARRRGVPVIKYAALLGALTARRCGIAVSGTHGKSTTTAWLAYVLRRAGLDPSFVVGGECDQLGGGSGVGDGPHFVVEACEYDRSFLHLRPRAAAILNIEEDHLDYYADVEAIQAAFGEFAGLLPADGLLVLNGQDPRCRSLAGRHAGRVETFGLEGDVTWRAAQITVHEGCYELDVLRGGTRLGRVRLGLPGRHNLMNALAVIALAWEAGVTWPQLEESLGAFRGVRRRLELRGEERGVRILDDYAHHPTEIRATLLAARERYRPARLWCVFQPHQHSRTRFLLEDFARSFDQADRIIVPEIYFVRDSARERELVCGADLVERLRQSGRQAEYVADFSAIAAALAGGVRPGDAVITMGAGDIWKVADELVRRLRGDLPA